MTDKEFKGFHVTRGRGFQVRFANGWGVSVQFGWGNYCDNMDAATSAPENFQRLDEELGEKGCANAEIAILCPGGGLLDVEEWGDSVKGHVTPDELLDVLIEVQAKE